MILPISLLGWRRAAKRGGERLDKIQYAAAHGIGFALLALAIAVLADHLIV